MKPRFDPIAELAMHGREGLRAARLYWHERTPQAWRQAACYTGLKLARRFPPVTITLAPTFRCPCRCVHCFAAVGGRDAPDELTLDEVRSILDQSRRIGTMHVIFSGGEPLLRGDLEDMVAHARRIGLLTRVSTSGILLTRERVAELKKAGLQQCGVSIDDPDPATHDRLRGVPGLHARAMQGVEYLREAGVLTKMLVCTARRNVTAGLERLVAEARRRGMMGVYLLLPTAAGRWDGAFDEVLSEEETERVRGLQDLTRVHMELSTRGTNCCAYQRKVFYVGAFGDMTPCSFVPFPMGNVRREPLADIWRRHTRTIRLRTYGTCPLNDPADRAALEAHTEAVRRAGPA